MLPNRQELAIGKRVKTIHGFSIITHYYETIIFGIRERFYELDSLEYEMLIGIVLLKKANVTINLEKETITYGKKVERIYVNSNESENKEAFFNNILDIDTLRNNIINNIEIMHSDINTVLPFRTDVKAEIRTIVETPIWSKQYPYPFSANAFINNEIKKLLANGIIRQSKSPYNSPIWVVPKKGANEDGTQKMRMVVDYKKLNEQTIADKYPIPDCNVILSNLGRAKFFSTIDLESGFHQILMKPEDIEKTAFSVNNGKYEFVRMPFGLKNGPGIFQRAMDNILREYVGKICHVYIDDIIVYSESLEAHIEHLQTIIKTLKDSNMKISLEKSEFFQQEVEFLGYIVGYNVIKTDPKKIQTISEFPKPTTLRQLRSFLGMTGYYRKFISGYASIARPLTKYLAGENGRISQNMSKKTEIKLDNEAIKAFERLKKLLINQVELTQPDFSKKFVLTTDASNVAIGGVLTQEGKPITFISKTLNSTEQNYATNEKELYAIVWSLKTLRNYLYGAKDLEIHTDHQPLTFAVSTRNPNAKIKRWRSFIEEFSPKLVYKPGITNIVADALSRQILNNLSDDSSVEGTQHSAESSDNNFIPETRKPLNEFKQQILLSRNNFTIHESITNFNRTRHIIEYDSRENLLTILKEFLQPNLVTAIYCTLEDLYDFKETVRNVFSNKFVFTQIFAVDVVNADDQKVIIEQTHNRAHRNCKENCKQIYMQYYWPKMADNFKEYIKHCDICNRSKYNRHPQKVKIGETPIPEREGEYLNLDIFYAQNLKFITCIDSYSKFLVIKQIDDKLNLGEKVMDVLQSFPSAKKITLDNEPGFTTAQFKSLMQRLRIELYYCTPRHSTTNGIVERVHSTLVELARCIKEEYHVLDDCECFYRASQQYNKSVHSVTGEKPEDIFFNKITHDNIVGKLKKAQEKMLQKSKDSNIKTYQINDIVYEKIIGQRNKLAPRFKKQKVKEDLGNKIKIHSRDRIIHKTNIKN